MHLLALRIPTHSPRHPRQLSLPAGFVLITVGWQFPVAALEASGEQPNVMFTLPEGLWKSWRPQCPTA